MGREREQEAAARAVKRALTKARDAGLGLRVYDGSVWLIADEIDLWPNGDKSDPIAILYECGFDVKPSHFTADGGAGR